MIKLKGTGLNIACPVVSGENERRHWPYTFRRTKAEATPGRQRPELKLGAE
jgi:hypothetical protein